MNEVRLKDIKVGPRHRKDLGDLDALVESIRRVGLLHPVVVSKDKKLICGQRRLEAFRKLGRATIPAHIVSLDDLLLAERDENVVRADFLPTEAVAIGTALEDREKVLAKERQQATVVKPGEKLRKGDTPSRNGGGKLPPPNEKGKARDKAAAVVGMSGRTFDKAKAVVEAAERNPQKFGDLPAEMDKTGKVSQVFQEVKRREKRDELARKAEAVPDDAKSTWQVVHGDCCDELGKLKTGSARLIFADPPYNLGVDYGDGTKADNLSDDDYLRWVEKWTRQCVRVLADDGSLWVMICDEYADHFGVLLRKVGLHRRAWVKWYETFGVNCPNNFNRCSRHIHYFVKDSKQFVFHLDAIRRPSDRQLKYNDPRACSFGKTWDDVWEIPRLVGTAKERIPDFPTQVPLTITRAIVGCASEPGDLVIDPFSGSASTGVACIELGRRYLGIKRQGKFVELSQTRLKGVQACG